MTGPMDCSLCDHESCRVMDGFVTIAAPTKADKRAKMAQHTRKDSDEAKELEGIVVPGSKVLHQH